MTLGASLMPRDLKAVFPECLGGVCGQEPAARGIENVHRDRLFGKGGAVVVVVVTDLVSGRRAG